MDSERSLALDIDYLGVSDPGDGVAGADFTQYPEIDTVAFNFSEPKEISFTGMGREDPWAVVSKKGDPSSIEFAIPSPKATELVAFCGGKATGNKWEAPSSTPTIIKTIKLQTSPYEGNFTEYVFVKTSIAARISQAPGKEETDLLLVKATILSAVSAAGVRSAPYIREVKAVVAADPKQVSAQSAETPISEPIGDPEVPNDGSDGY